MIYGAELTAAEKKALDIEIKHQLAEYNHKNLQEIDAMILWELHEQLGFGEKRLKEFYKRFVLGIQDLNERYELGSEDNCWLCTKKLKYAGFDIEKW